MKRELLRSGVAVILLRIVGAVLGLAVTVMLSRTVGADGLGIYAYAVTCLALAAVPVSYGWSMLLLRATSTATHDDTWSEAKTLLPYGALAAILVTLLAALAGLVLIEVFRGVVPRAIGAGTLLLMLSLLLLDQLSALRVSMIRGIGKPLHAQVPDLIARPVLFMVFFAAAYWFFGEMFTIAHMFAALASAALLNALFGYVILWRISPAGLTCAPRGHFRFAWLSSAVLLTGNGGLVMLNASIGILVLGLFVGAAELGIYRVATQVGLLSGIGYAGFSFIAAQRFAAGRSAGNRDGLQASASYLARLALLAALPIPLFLWFLGNELVEFAFGAQFTSAVNPMLVLCASQIISAALGMSQTLLLMKNEEKKVLVATALSVVANGGLCFLLIPQYGILGAAISALVATGGWNAALWLVASQKFSVDTSVLNIRLPFRHRRIAPSV